MSGVSKLLYRFTAGRPCRLIHRHKNERYLERYWLGRVFGVTAYLHRFVARDADDWVHDHPWGWSVAIVLTGRYQEERLKWFDPAVGWTSVFRVLRAGRINIIRGQDFHRITDCQPETWTLFIHGPRRKGWGFLEKSEAVVCYYQPYDTAVSHQWHTRVPTGRNADRAPLPRAA
ncbi:MAG TPA: hypothetical protein ENI94_02520 [Gammaproteobacteria bacterium]|nr:hypothetical protein [Gammaproteobacteria bacterium]